MVASGESDADAALATGASAMSSGLPRTLAMSLTRRRLTGEAAMREVIQRRVMAVRRACSAGSDLIRCCGESATKRPTPMTRLTGDVRRPGCSSPSRMRRQQFWYCRWLCGRKPAARHIPTTTGRTVAVARSEAELRRPRQRHGCGNSNTRLYSGKAPRQQQPIACGAAVPLAGRKAEFGTGYPHAGVTSDDDEQLSCRGRTATQAARWHASSTQSHADCATSAPGGNHLPTPPRWRDSYPRLTRQALTSAAAIIFCLRLGCDAGNADPGGERRDGGGQFNGTAMSRTRQRSRR